MAESTAVMVTAPKVGDYVYVRDGISAFFYDDDKCTKQVGPSGGKGGQDNSPHNNAGEVMGIATGRFTTNNDGLFSIELDWVNEWYQDPKTSQAGWINPIIGIINIANVVRGGTFKKENRTSWAKASQVKVMDKYLAPNLDTSDPLGDMLTNSQATTGNYNIYLYIGLAVAVLYKFKDKLFGR